MEQHLLSPDSAKPSQGYFGAGVKRRDTNDSITEDQKFETRVSRGDTQRGERRDSDSNHAPDSPRQQLYDSPLDHNNGDIPMIQMDEPQFATSMFPGSSKGEYGFLGGTTFGDDSDKRSLLSAKKYDHRETRKFLFKTGFFRLGMTIFFCAAIALSLKGFEGFKKPKVIGKNHVRVFNALMIGLSLALGLNLASSLKRYAVILRWSLLTRRYVSLEVFDLILGLETLTKVGKLMIISIPGIRRFKMLRNLPWFREARDDGTKLTWIVCLVWILVNIGAQTLVASLSLFWPVEPSSTPLLTYGGVKVSDLSMWQVDPIRSDRNVTAMERAWYYGNEASSYPIREANESVTDMSSLPGPPSYRLGNGHYEYRFFHRNPDHEFAQYYLTSRKIESKATCTQLDLLGKTKPEADEDTNHWFMMGKKPGDEEPEKHFLPFLLPAAISWTASLWEHCGPRCTNFTVFQYTDANITVPALFLCESTISDVHGGEKELRNLTPKDKEAVYGSNGFARIAAGAMAWTGYTESDWDDRQTRAYTRGSMWSPYRMIKKEEVEDMLARFTIGAIAAFDDHGLRYKVENQWSVPVRGQKVEVDWSYILGLLGGICLIQTVALVLLLTFANKSIIRDESFFSLAMLLSPVVGRLGEEGMNLTGEEIKNHPRLLWKRIRYDYEEKKNGVNQVKIHIQGKDTWESRRSWAGGYYN